jgi:hypothetical protein
MRLKHLAMFVLVLVLCAAGAFNPRTQLFTSAIIGDTEPANNLGEGTSRPKYELLGATTPPTNIQETFRLSIENTKVLIAIILARVFSTWRNHTRLTTLINAWTPGALKQASQRLKTDRIDEIVSTTFELKQAERWLLLNKGE